MPDALVIVDVQNDFCPGGALPAPDGDAVVPVLNAYLARAQDLLVFASRDWHPSHSAHFQAGGGPWPPHCVQGTPGAEFHPALRLPEGTMVVSKGMAGEDDGYSALEGLLEDGRDMATALGELAVRRAYVGGLATDYCVRATVLDALRAGLEVYLLADAVRAVEVHPGDAARALEEMRQAGAQRITLAEFPAPGGTA